VAPSHGHRAASPGLSLKFQMRELPKLQMSELSKYQMRDVFSPRSGGRVERVEGSGISGFCPDGSRDVTRHRGKCTRCLCEGLVS